MARKICIALLLSLVTVVVYWPALHAEFLNFDDPLYVTNNPHVLHGWTMQSVAWAFSTFYASNWHPVTWLTHVLDCQLFGQHAKGHHAVNLLLHIVNSLLLLRVLQRMTHAFWRSALVAALFALHPLHVESVAWVSERKDVLSALFFLLSLWAYCRYVEGRGERAEDRNPKPEGRTLRPQREAQDLSRAGQSPKSGVQHPASSIPFRAPRPFYLLCLVCFALGLMSKPMLVTLPFVLLLLDYWPLRRLGSATAQAVEPGPAWFSLVWEKSPFFILAAISSVLTLVAQAKGGAIVAIERLPLKARVLNALMAYTGYLKKAVWPLDLSVIYPLTTSWPTREIALAIAVFIAGSALALVAARRWPFLFVGWFWYVGSLLPVIGLVQVGLQAMADRYTYLPLIGVFVAVVWGVAEWLGESRCGCAIGSAAGCLLLAACAAAARHQAEFWRNSTVLFQHAVEIRPQNFLAQHHLGLAFMTSSKCPEAIEHLSEAIRFEANYPHAWFSRGTTFGLMGNLPAAMNDFREAIRLKPDYHQAYSQLGKVLALQGRFDEAETNFLEAVRFKSDYAEAQALLGNVLQLEGRVVDAMPHLEAAVRAQPDYSEGHYYLATALSSQRRLPEAAAHLECALRYKPDSPSALNDLAMILVRPSDSGRDLARGAQLAQKACELTGYQNPFCLQTFAVACAETGRFTEATRLAQQALELATRTGNAELAAALREQLADFQQGLPFREKPR